MPDEIEALDLVRKASHVLSKYRGNIGDVAAEAQNRAGLYVEYYVARNDKGDVRLPVSQWCGFWERRSKVFKQKCRVTEGGGVALQAFVESAIASDVIANTMMEQCEQDALRDKESRDALIVESMQLADMLPSNVQELVAASKDLQEVLGLYRQLEEGKKQSNGPR